MSQEEIKPEQDKSNDNPAVAQNESDTKEPNNTEQGLEDSLSTLRPVTKPKSDYFVLAHLHDILKEADSAKGFRAATSRSTEEVQDETINVSPSLEKKLRFDADGEASEERLKKHSTFDEMSPRSRGMRLEQKSVPRTCQKFLPINEFSEFFVEEVMEDASVRAREIVYKSATKYVEGVEVKAPHPESETSSSGTVGTYVCILEWPTISEFHSELGTMKINEFISYWRFKEAWKYCINYLRGESDQTCDIHQYEAIFSIPCPQYPVPQATASVYFTIYASRVEFCFEGRRFKHNPRTFQFQEVFLFNIVDAKIKFFKTLNF